jgi:hypothetical protein
MNCTSESNTTESLEASTTASVSVPSIVRLVVGFILCPSGPELPSRALAGARQGYLLWGTGAYVCTYLVFVCLRVLCLFCCMTYLGTRFECEITVTALECIVHESTQLMLLRIPFRLMC